MKPIDLQAETRKVLAEMTPEQENELRKRFGIEDTVAPPPGATRERIKKIEMRALRKLRHPTRSKRLKSFMD